MTRPQVIYPSPIDRDVKFECVYTPFLESPGMKSSQLPSSVFPWQDPSPETPPHLPDEAVVSLLPEALGM